MPKKTRLSFYEHQKIQFAEDLEKVVHKFGIKSFTMEFHVHHNKYTSVNIHSLLFKDSTQAEKNLKGKKVYTQNATGPTSPSGEDGPTCSSNLNQLLQMSSSLEDDGMPGATVEDMVQKFISLNVKFINHADFIKSVLSENLKLRSQDPNDELYQNNRPLNNHSYSIEMKNTQKNPISKSITQFLGEAIQSKIEKIKLENMLVIPIDETKPRKVIKI